MLYVFSRLQKINNRKKSRPPTTMNSISGMSVEWWSTPKNMHKQLTSSVVCRWRYLLGWAVWHPRKVLSLWQIQTTAVHKEYDIAQLSSVTSDVQFFCFPNYTFFWYFNPEKTCFDNKYEYFPGWPNRYIRAEQKQFVANTGLDLRARAGPYLPRRHVLRQRARLKGAFRVRRLFYSAKPLHKQNNTRVLV